MHRACGADAVQTGLAIAAAAWIILVDLGVAVVVQPVAELRARRGIIDAAVP
jgi:hypothetical protein